MDFNQSGISYVPLNENDITSIAKFLRNQQCVLFIGDEIALASENEGYLTTQELGRRLQAELPVSVPKDLSFHEALHFIEVTHKSQLVSEMIADVIMASSYTKVPLKFHRQVTQLPPNSIVTTAWDTLLESAFEKDRVSIITDDSSVSHFRNGTIPLVKVFGSLMTSDPHARIYYSPLSSVECFFSERHLVKIFMRIILSQKRLLFLGFNPNDRDFIRLFRSLQRELELKNPKAGESKHDMRYSYIVSSAITDSPYWQTQQQQVRVIHTHPTTFLESINHRISFDSSVAEGQNEGIGHVWSLPSENQVIEALLRSTVEALEGEGNNFEEIRKRFKDDVHNIRQLRPYDVAIKTLEGDGIDVWFASSQVARAKIHSLLDSRAIAKASVAKKGVGSIHANDKVLLYGHSTCVHAVINTWLKDGKGKKTLDLYIAEARPRSYRLFEDAMQTLRVLELDYAEGINISLIYDASIATMIKSRKITKVFLGAHEVRQNSQGDYQVVNVGGSLLIACLCEAMKDVALYVCVENDKIVQGEHTGKEGTRERLIDEKKGKYEAKEINMPYDTFSSSEFTFTIISQDGLKPVGPRNRPQP